MPWCEIAHRLKQSRRKNGDNNYIIYIYIYIEGFGQLSTVWLARLATPVASYT